MNYGQYQLDTICIKPLPNAIFIVDTGLIAVNGNNWNANWSAANTTNADSVLVYFSTGDSTTHTSGMIDFPLNTHSITAKLIAFGECGTDTFSQTIQAFSPYIDSKDCITCDSLNIRDQFVVGIDTFIVVDRPMLDSMIVGGFDVTKACVSHITDLSNAFNGQSTFNQNIGNWDVSNVTTFNYLFRLAVAFNQDLGNWDVSAGTSMVGMFSNAKAFNQDITSWDVSNVTNMADMFYNAYVFNQDIGSWDVSSVTRMSAMFSEAFAFNGDISNWDVSNVQFFQSLFIGATSFNRDLSNWNVTGCTTMSNMFNGATSFNQDISSWDVSNVQYMNGMFSGATSFNKSLNDWDVSNVLSMEQMFRNASSFNDTITDWDVSNVENMHKMFQNASAFNQNISSWNTSSVTNISEMFYAASDFNQNVGSWDVSNVTNMNAVFSITDDFNQDLGNWNVAKVTSMTNMFADAASFSQDLSGWCVPLITSKPSGFDNNSALTTSQLPNWGDCPCSDTIVTQPQDFTYLSGNSTAPSFFVSHSSDSASFQWQQNLGFGWVNVLDTGIYSGANNDTLLLNNPRIELNATYYRAIIGHCFTTDTTSLALLTLIDSCQAPPAPIDLHFTQILGNALTVNINDTAHTGLYSIEYGPCGFQLGSGTMLSNITDTSYTVLSLDTNTCYDFFVSATCTNVLGAVASPWAGPFSIGTSSNCNETIPYYEDFAYSTGMGAPGFPDLPSCWSAYFTPNSSDNFLYVDHWGGNWGVGSNDSTALYFSTLSAGAQGNGDTAMAILPQMSMLNQGSYQIKIFAKALYLNTVFEAKIIVGTLSNQYDLSTMHIVDTIEVNSLNFQEYSVNLNGIPSNANRIFLMVNPNQVAGKGVGANNVFIDKLEVTEQCDLPTQFKLAAVNTTAAQLQWTATTTNFELQYGNIGFNPSAAAGTSITITDTNSALLSGLQPNTDYHVFIRSTCNASVSSAWVGPLTISTLCNPTALPYHENFGYTTGAGSYSNPDLPECWSVYQNNGVYKSYVYVDPWKNSWGSGSSDSALLHFSTYANTSGGSGDTTMVILPPMQGLATANHQITLSARALYNYRVFKAEVIVGTIDSLGSIPSMHIIDTLVFNSTNYKDYSLPLLNLPYNNGRIFLMVSPQTLPGRGIGFNNVFIDQISITPYCPQPQNLAVANAYSKSAKLQWSDLATDYDIEYGPKGFIPGKGTRIIGIDTNHYTLKGLTPNTEYDLYLRSQCTSTVVSAWTGPLTLQTLCSPYSLPFIETFDYSSGAGQYNNPDLPQCWDYWENDSNYNSYAFVDTWNNSWGAGSLDSAMLYFHSYTQANKGYGDTAMVILPNILGLQQNNVFVKVSGRALNLSNVFSAQLIVGTMDSTMSIASMNALDTIEFSTLTFTSDSVLLTNLPNNANRVFLMVNPKQNSNKNYAFNNLYLDHVEIKQACVAPTISMNVSNPAAYSNNEWSVTWNTNATNADSTKVFFSDGSTSAATSGTIVFQNTTINAHGYAIAYGPCSIDSNYVAWSKPPQPATLFNSEQITVCKGDIVTLETSASHFNYNEYFGLCSLTDYFASGGNITISNNSYSGCGVNMTHYAGQSQNNFFLKGQEFGYGHYELFANATSFISDNIIRLFADSLMTTSGITISLRPGGTDNPGWTVSSNGLTLQNSNTFPVYRQTWYKVGINISPDSLKIYINNSLLFETDSFGSLPTSGKFKLGVAYSGSYDNLSYQPLYTGSYLWSDLSTTSSITIQADSSTHYSVVKSDTNNSWVDSIYINVIDSEIHSSLNSICQGDSIVLGVPNTSTIIDSSEFRFMGSLQGKDYYECIQPLTYQKAVEKVQSMGVNLVKVESAQLNQFLTQNKTQPLLLGATDSLTEGTFKWYDGTNLTYSNWRSGEPNDAGAGSSCRPLGEDYIIIENAGTWNDVPNSYCGTQIQHYYAIEVTSGTQGTFVWSTGNSVPLIVEHPSVNTQYWLTQTTNGTTCSDTVNISVHAPFVDSLNALGNISLSETDTTVFFSLNQVDDSATFVWQSKTNTSSWNSIQNDATYAGVNTSALSVYVYSYSQDSTSFRSIVSSNCGVDTSEIGNIYVNPSYITKSGDINIEQVDQTQQDQNAQAPIAIVPNPSHGIFEIRNLPSDATYELQNLLGQRMIHNGRNSSVNISDLPNGTYLLIVHSNGEQIVERIIKTE
ncbi:BspA family leucine-rich repeat surface protein [Schleiferiaceae bacterium]|nr:BspA family leucine-rich repeat surface protein [Schleiferiaceae bacterium]